MLLEILGSVAVFHFAPNLAMKAIKKTKKGQEVLSATFSAGIELGRKGKKLHSGLKHIMTYGLGPETLVEYELGLKIGRELSRLSHDEQEIYLSEVKLEILATLKTFSNDEKETLMKTPVMNTMVDYAEGRINLTAQQLFTTFAQDSNVKTSKKTTAILFMILGLLTALNAHILCQPVICLVRKKLAGSKFGKKFMKKNFDKGLHGEILPKYQRAIIDLTISPSALDTMRLGKGLESNTKLNKFFK